jgi:hypothetical protein
MEQYLFEDLRLDEEGFKQLGRENIIVLSGLYGSTNVRLLAEYLKRSAR